MRRPEWDHAGHIGTAGSLNQPIVAGSFASLYHSEAGPSEQEVSADIKLTGVQPHHHSETQRGAQKPLPVPHIALLKHIEAHMTQANELPTRNGQWPLVPASAAIGIKALELFL